MTKSLIGAVLPLAAGFFLAGLAFGQSSAGQLPTPGNPVSRVCTGPCRQAANLNSQARASRPGAATPLPNFKKSTQYSIARERLLESGWKPANPADDRCEKGDARCEARPETQACAGTGEANCMFLWQKNGRAYEINTTGDPALIAVATSCRLRLGKAHEVQRCSSLSKY